MRIGTIRTIETVEPEPMILPSTPEPQREAPAEPLPVEEPVEEPAEPAKV